MATISVSSRTVPRIQPMTEMRASFSRLGGEELLVHHLVAEHQQHGGDEELHGAAKDRLPST